MSRHVSSNLRPLQEYLDDDNVIEIRINRYFQIVLDTRQGRVIKENLAISPVYIHNLLSSLLSMNQLPRKAINNVILPDGSRCIFVLPPAVINDTLLVAIRKHLPVMLSLEDLDQQGRFSTTSNMKIESEQGLQEFEHKLLSLLEERNFVEFMRLAVKSKRNIAIAGTTGSGKSTFTRSLMGEIPRSERIIVLEDVHEPVADDTQEEIGFMLYGEKGQEGRLTPSECIKACMRLTPDRIILTELRDDAAWDYLTAGKSGHGGSIFSVHASSAFDTPARIAQLVKQSVVGQALDYDLIMHTIHTTLDVVVYMEHYNIVEVLYDPEFKKKMMIGAS
ncbi:ATPase, T2SS/T4P/T4SS family [Halomonas sp. 3A7M]|uniref:ATPase, T2SS/T4P/T4SS family n=1 Tax=Halomonas sp. 3A7M TaxID=2742616 RepID=UPI001866D16D|nr:ATPase, T2SS/T4P/T4SS family [Halomonas sp. 3A7M]